MHVPCGDWNRDVCGLWLERPRHRLRKTRLVLLLEITLEQPLATQTPKVAHWIWLLRMDAQLLYMEIPPL